MRVLAIHADSMSYKANRKTKFAEEITEKEGFAEDCVVLLTSVEKLDEVNPGRVADASVGEVLERLEKLKARRVLIFPFAHLTSTLSSPAVALQVLKGMEAGLTSAGIEVKRAPFGWYKEYSIKSKGHPMAEMSMTICPYEACGQTCDFLCPYCENPIKLRDLGEIEAEKPGAANAAAVPIVPPQGYK